jgi:uncharacterized protein YbbC (DUF1343 family)
MTANLKIFVLLFVFWQQGCLVTPQKNTTSGSSTADTVVVATPDEPNTSGQQPVQVGAARTEMYFPQLAGKRLGLVVNHTSMIGKVHLVDTLLTAGLQVVAIFAPEHGFRGAADAGEKIDNSRDPATGIPLISLYGSHKEPTAADLANIDLILFDIQDVGARFYTYISTMHYVMQSAAKYGKPMLILDRPNPNGHYVDGPILDPAFRSFVGMHPVPIVHGMTVGEYARMINGESWLENGLRANLQVIPCTNYTHQTPYELPVAPSPNLPNMRAIYLYPSLCFFEGTIFSVGRGTDAQFQLYGHPDCTFGSYQFTPHSGPGSKYPPLEDKLCYGVSLTQLEPAKIREEGQLNLFYILQAYTHFPDQADFFLKNNFIDKLAGSSQLRQQIEAGWDQARIRASWQPGLINFKQIRVKYLLYE